METVIPDTPEIASEPLQTDRYIIVGKIGNEYVVKTHKGLKRVKIKASDNKRIGDQIKIEKL